MKDQYVGDINDYRKYALLRALSSGGANHIGVCWMLTLSDGRSDGNKLTYLQQPERHRHVDPELFDILAHAASAPERRRLATIEDSGAIPGALYHNDLLPDELAGRHAFMGRCAYAFRDADLIFFDPDNGLEVALPKGRKNSSKYLYLDEVAAFYASGKSLLIYQHFPRVERAVFLARCAERLRVAAPGASLWAFTTAHVVFLLLLHPASSTRLHSAADAACSRWTPEFISGKFLGIEPATP
ncbi:hypothetical protein KYK30_09820 [Shinella yambaruensis]|uniref:Uncharacterized protein n=1 Tax=Shinella yambaruensis TaxID=415996 RepID=A0ABQ5ZTH7_9HYPH|nr:hypothetical protein [Shinella yambaruensis]MCJ8027921.1 hypothetical protein [Shinella yambaruensis]MCU7979991.1 hypothetical protein [Shinella yambaruensis]GLR55257.1 hypothetical protein GCM10007923_64800 [Shinella yambaruensis]